MADIQMVVGVDYSELTGLIKTGEQTKRVLSSVAKDFARTGNQKQYMHSINKIAMAQKNLDVSARMSRGELMRLGAEMQREQKFTDALAASTNRLGGAMSMSKNKMNGSNVAVQQLGYQMGDFAVQVQGGTSAFVAFSQQATQLVGILPMVAGPLGLTVGAAVGLSAALGVLIPIGSALGRMFFEMKDSAKGAAESADTYADALKRIVDQTNELRNARLGIDPTVALINEERNRLTNEISLKQIAIAGRQSKTRLDPYDKRQIGFRQDEIVELEKLLDLENKKLGRIHKLHKDETNFAREREQSANRQIGQIKYRFRLEDQLMGIAVEVDKKAQEKRAKAAIEASREAMIAFTKFEDQKAMMSRAAGNVQAAEAQKETAEQIKAQDKYLTAIEESHKAGTDLSKLNLKSPFESALPAARLLADQMKVSLVDAMNLINLATAGTAGGRGGVLPDDIDISAMAAGGIKLPSYKKPKSATKRDPVGDFETRLKLERELLNATEARQKVLQALGSDFVRDNPKRAAAMEVTITETNRLIAVEEKRQGLIDSITGSIENGMMAMIDGTMSVKDAFKSMAAEIIKELYRVLVVQQMVNAAKGFFGITAADGAVVSGGSEVKAYANGGVVSGPTTFPMAGGKTGLMGEAGPEAIMPLKRGSNGKLGVQMEGGSQGNVVINQSFNFQANGDDSVKKLIAQAAPKIADMAKASVIDSRRRGGSTKAAFG